MPPPPVAGAAAGNTLADGLGVGEGVGEGEGDGDGLAVADALAEGLAVGVAVGVAVSLVGVTVAVPLGRAVGVGKPVLVGVPPGEIDGGVAEGELPEQAETDTDASTATVAQPKALNLPLSRVPAMVVRI